jgi:hypothetical protein
MSRLPLFAAVCLLLGACSGVPTLPAGLEMPPPGLKLRLESLPVVVGSGLIGQKGGANGSSIYLIAGEEDSAQDHYHVQMSLVGKKRLDEGFTKDDLTAAGCQVSVNRLGGLYVWVPESGASANGLAGLTLLSTRGRLTAIWQGRLQPATAGTIAKLAINVAVGINVAFSDLKDARMLIQHLRWFAGLPLWQGPSAVEAAISQ